METQFWWLGLLFLHSGINFTHFSHTPHTPFLLLNKPETGQDVYRGHQHWTPDKISVTFGGHEVCQALAAASRTLEGSHRHKMVNSVHSYFLRPGDLIKPIDYKVD